MELGFVHADPALIAALDIFVNKVINRQDVIKIIVPFLSRSREQIIKNFVSTYLANKVRRFGRRSFYLCQWCI